VSKYRKIKVEFKSEDALRAALDDVAAARGLEYEYHPQGDNLRGYMGDMRAETAQFIIRRRYVGQSANDLGFQLQANGTYSLLISDYDTRHRGQRIANDIKQRYAYHQTMNLAMQNGYQVIETVQPDGSIVLELQRSY